MPGGFERFEKRILDSFDRWQLGAVARLGRAQYWLETHGPEVIVDPPLIKAYVNIFAFQLGRIQNQIPKQVESNLFKDVNLAISIAADGLFNDEQSKVIAWTTEHIEQGLRAKPDVGQKAHYARWFTVEMVKALLNKTDTVKGPRLGDALRATASGVFSAGADLSETLGAHRIPDASKQSLYDAIQHLPENRNELFDRLARFVNTPALV